MTVTLYDNKGEAFTVSAEDFARVWPLRWRTDSTGYLRTEVDGRPVRLHRFLLDAGKLLVDHIDCNTRNNTRGNLRLATKSQNACNSRKHRDGKSGYKGVTWDRVRGQWLARISVNGRRHHLGYYDTPEAAHVAYSQASAGVHGDFGRAA